MPESGFSCRCRKKRSTGRSNRSSGWFWWHPGVVGTITIEPVQIINLLFL
ncbi:hypothetical protein A2U01_0069974, partial [Trifolium medium]|nr:hypothetical protein [Trifolium medium]